jgi:hypothetical protein
MEIGDGGGAAAAPSPRPDAPHLPSLERLALSPSIQKSKSSLFEQIDATLDRPEDNNWSISKAKGIPPSASQPLWQCAQLLAGRDVHIAGDNLMT